MMQKFLNCLLVTIELGILSDCLLCGLIIALLLTRLPLAVMCFASLPALLGKALQPLSNMWMQMVIIQLCTSKIFNVEYFHQLRDRGYGSSSQNLLFTPYNN